MRCYDDAFLKAVIDAAGVDRTFFGSDLGQTNAPLPVEGFRQIIATCLGIGYSPDEIRKMVCTNAAQPVGLGANTE
jgi:hypothetical protein